MQKAVLLLNGQVVFVRRQCKNGLGLDFLRAAANIVGSMDKAELVRFVPMRRIEMEARGWDAIDILIVSGDAYVDHPSFGAFLIARVLLDAGYRVGIAAQPDWRDPSSLAEFGRPLIGCGVSAGNIDSMLKIYTAGRRLRREDMYSPGGRTGLCPPHASVVYSQLAKRAFPGLPVVVGGVEASMRRIAHYDYWQDKIRPSILADSKADLLCYGMGEMTMLEIFSRIARGETLEGIRGTCRYLGGKESDAFSAGNDCAELPSYEEVCSDKCAIMREMKIVESEMNPWSGRRLFQKTRGRILLVEPPREPMPTWLFDKFSELPFANRPHWSYGEKIPAWETVKDSVTVVRGCPGGCAFCGIAVHQGRHAVSRSEGSVIRSVMALSKSPSFRGTVSDVGGAAGNIYGHAPKNLDTCKKCKRYSCVFPNVCENYNIDEKPLISLLDKLKSLSGVKHVFINSGVRLDLALLQPKLTEKIIRDHVSGQISVAPEHLDARVLRLMRKGKAGEFDEFRKIFDSVNGKTGKKQYIVPYFISNFPGCTDAEMEKVRAYLAKSNWSPQQVQDFIPLPMTMGSAMYFSETAPDGSPITVNKGLAERRFQRDMIHSKKTEENEKHAFKKHHFGRRGGV